MTMPVWQRTVASMYGHKKTESKIPILFAVSELAFSSLFLANEAIGSISLTFSDLRPGAERPPLAVRTLGLKKGPHVFYETPLPMRTRSAMIMKIIFNKGGI